MPRASLLVLYLAGTSVIVPRAAWAQEALPTRHDDEEAAFVWIDTIDSLDTSKLVYGRASTGHWFQESGGDPQNTYVAGFLLSDDGATFVVRGVDLERHVFRRRVSSAKPEERIEFEPLDLAVDARAMAEKIRSAGKHDHDLRGYHEPGKTVRPIPAAVLLARGCARRGLAAASSELCAAIRERKCDPEGSLLDLVRDELVTSLWYQALSAFADVSRSRAELLALLNQYCTVFPESRNLPDATRLRVGLESLLADDARLAGSTPASRPESRAGKPTDREIEQWVHALREQVEPVKTRWGGQLEFLGWDPYRRDASESPSDRLASVGMRAAPFLIDAMSDSRPSRCVWYNSRFGGSFGVDAIGTLAAELLQVIFGIRLDGSVEKVQAHYARVRKGEEADALGEIVGVGDDSSGEVAQTLVARYPERALAPIARGARAASRGWARSGLVWAAAGLKTAEATGFLLDELRSSPFLGSRVVAAQALRERGRPEGLAVMIEAWRDRANRPVRDPFKDMEVMSDNTAVLEFLVSSGSLEAVQAIAETAGGSARMLTDAVTSWPESSPSDPATAEDRKQARRLLEELLVRGLDDDREIDGTVFRQHNGVVFDLVQPRVSDEVAWALAALSPDRYTFDSKLTRRGRDWQIATIRNKWREANGLPAFPIPESRVVGALSEATVASILDQIVTATTADGRRSWIGRLERLGPAAVPMATPRASKLDPGSVARKDLEAALHRLGCTVGAVKFVDEFRRAPAGLGARLERLKGSVLDAQAVIRLFVDAIDQTGGSVRLDVERGVENPGVLVSLRVLSDRGGHGCSTSFTARVGQKQLGSGWGSGIDEVWRSVADFESEIETITKVLDSAPDIGFEIHLERTVR